MLAEDKIYREDLANQPFCFVDQSVGVYSRVRTWHDRRQYVIAKCHIPESGKNLASQSVSATLVFQGHQSLDLRSSWSHMVAIVDYSYVRSISLYIASGHPQCCLTMTLLMHCVLLSSLPARIHTSRLSPADPSPQSLPRRPLKLIVGAPGLVSSCP